jgi:hypothetical protein
LEVAEAENAWDSFSLNSAEAANLGVRTRGNGLRTFLALFEMKLFWVMLLFRSKGDTHREIKTTIMIDNSMSHSSLSSLIGPTF